MYLKLEELEKGQIKVVEGIEEKVDYKPIIEKTSSTASHHMLGEIVAKDGKRVRITTRHIFILEPDEDEVRMTHVFENRNIARFICCDGKWVYVLKRDAVAYDNVLGK